jgi:hypothetical protein
LVDERHDNDTGRGERHLGQRTSHFLATLIGDSAEHILGFCLVAIERHLHIGSARSLSSEPLRVDVVPDIDREELEKLPNLLRDSGIVLGQTERGYQRSLHKIQPARPVIFRCVLCQAALGKAKQCCYHQGVLANLDSQVTQESAAK